MQPANAMTHIAEENGRFTARFALEVPEAGIRDRLDPSFALSALSRQVQMLDALTELGYESSLELRLEALPQGAPRARVRLLLIGRVSARTEKETVEVAGRFLTDVDLLLPRDLGLYRFEPLDPSTLRIAESQWHLAEITRRDEGLALGSGTGYYVVRPYRTSTTTFATIFDLLGRSQVYTAWSAFLRPTRLLPFEEDYLREALGQLEREQTPRRAASSRTVAGAEAEVLKKMLRDQILEGRNLLLGRTIISSEAAIPQALLAMIGTEMTAHGDDTRHHAFRIRRPKDREQHAQLLRDLRDHGFNQIGPLLTRSYHQRLLYLFDPLEAVSLFRLPLPDHDGRVGSLPFPPVRSMTIPPDLPDSGFLIGEHVDDEARRGVYLSDDDLARHVYVIGQTGTGKSTLLRELVLQDIARGHGVGVIDPHGDLVESILRDLPPSRAGDVVLFDPKDTERPLGLNLFDARSEEEGEFLVSEGVGVFIRLYGEEIFSPRLQDYFRNMALSVIKSPDGGVIADLVRLTLDESFRKKVSSGVRDPILKQFWVQYDLQGHRERDEMIAYWASKFAPFYAEPMMRTILGQVKPLWRVDEVMDEGEILLVNLAKGAIGDQNSALLGQLLMAKIQTAVMMRARQSIGDRKSFHLYIDEFQNYVSPGVVTLLSEGRKYGLMMVLANQFTSQLSRIGTHYKQPVDVLGAVTGNVGNLIVFRVGADDAQLFSRQFGGRYSEQEIAMLPNFSAIARLLNRGQVGSPIPIMTRRSDSVPSEAKEKAIRAYSRLKYGQPRVEVEADLYDHLGMRV